jgi:hypothetical protein
MPCAFRQRAIPPIDCGGRRGGRADVRWWRWR